MRDSRKEKKNQCEKGKKIIRVTKIKTEKEIKAVRERVGGKSVSDKSSGRESVRMNNMKIKWAVEKKVDGDKK